MKKLLTTAAAIVAIAFGANADVATWFNPQIETYTTWPTNNAAEFGGEWSGVDNATLSDDGLVIDGDVAFVATEAKALADGDVIINGRWTADPCGSLPEIPQIAKCGICALEDSNSASNFYHVIAFNFGIGSNTWVNTGIESTTNDTFSAKISASSNGLEFVSVVYSFSGGRDVATDVFVGENASNVSHVMLSGSGTLSSLSATANHAYHPLRSINVNFTAGVSLGTSDFETLVGAEGYAIPCAAWDNVVAVNGTNNVRVYRNNSGEYDETPDLVAIVENTRGYYRCYQLASTNNLLYGYIDDIVGSMSPIVKVTGIPFEKYRAVIYFSTDAANAKFGHLTVNGINLTSDNLNLGTEGGYVTRYGNSAWGNAGGSNSALPLAQGVNYLITPVLEGGQLDVHTHNFREESLLVRGTIAAIQIVETEEDVVRREVVFDIGDGAMHVGGGELVQTVVEGAAVVEPIVVATNGTFFSGWDMDFSCVTNDMRISASYADYPSRSINVNFTAMDSLDSSDFETLIGAYGYAIPCAAWDNVIAANGTNDVRIYSSYSGQKTSIATAIIENARGYWSCYYLSGANSLLHGYIDDIIDEGVIDFKSPSVKVTGIPFEKYRAVIYFSTDVANARFGHLTVNGINLTSDNLNLGTEGGYVTRYGSSAWGNTGGLDSALPLAQGVNYLITPVLEGGQLDVHTHNFREGSLFVRGTIAAMQIVETGEDVVRHQVVFDIGDGAMHVGGGELVQTVVEGAAAVEPDVVATNGTFFSGWDVDFSCVTNDMVVAAMYQRPIAADLYVDAAMGADENDGKSGSSALKSLQAAVDISKNGDVICVAPGVYAPLDIGSRDITIIGIEGAGTTFIDGSLTWSLGITNRCATLGTTTNTVLRGFTLVNGIAPEDNYYGGGAYYGTLEDCVISNCTARYGGGTYYSSLKRCVVKNNVATFYGGGTYYGTTESTLIAENSTTNRCGGTYYGTHVNSTITANTAGIAPGGCFGGTIRNTISYANTASSGSSNYYNVTNTVCEYSCVFPSQTGTGNINSNPKFVNSAAGDYALQSSSPCVNAGWNYLSVGANDLSGRTRYRGPYTDIGAFELQEGREYPESLDTLYVSVDNGSDVNDGLTWNSAFKTIQAAINSSCPGMTIVVTNGTYSPITATLNKAIRITSVNGADVTSIDGNNSTRCAVLGTTTSDRASVLAGFTLRKGYVSSGNGGGVLYGTLEDCIITACRAINSSEFQGGGGSYYTDANRCVYDGNTARNNGGAAFRGTLIDCVIANNTTTYWGGGTGYSVASNCVYYGNSCKNSDGGAVCYGTLYSCIITNNVSARSGGGTDRATLYNCLVARNKASSSGGGMQEGVAYNSTICDNTAPYRGGMQGGTAYNCIIWGNTETKQTSNYANVSNTVCYSTCTLPLQGNDLYNISADPLFEDAASGNYMLSTNSPCIDSGINRYAIGSSDLDGRLRISNRRVDMGAYEYQRNIENDGGNMVWHVDAMTGDDGNDGGSFATARKSINSILLNLIAGDKIIVSPGVYPPIVMPYGVDITIESSSGAENTIIDASLQWAEGITNRCASLETTEVKLKGFTLINGRAATGGGAYYGTLEDCVVSNCTAYSNGGGCAYSTVYRCKIVDNNASQGGGLYSGLATHSFISGNNVTVRGGGVCSGRIVDCMVVENIASGQGGGGYNINEVFNCTIAANKAAKGGGLYATSYPRAYNSIIWGNTLLDGITTDNWVARIPRAYFYNCCSTPLQTSGPGSGTSFDSDPYLCRFADGTYRVPVGSCCIDAGNISFLGQYGYDDDKDFMGNDRVQGEAVDIGAIEGGFAGVVVSTRCEGLGKISDSVACNSGETVVVEVSAHDSIHEFAGIFVNGEDATESATLTDGIYRLSITPTANTTVVARFLPTTIYVSPSGDDSATGGSWDAAKQTIQGAIDASSVNDTIIVTNGTYGAIRMVQNYPLLIQSVEGRDATVIDGEDSARCAQLGSDTTSTNVVLVGFTLANGNAGSSYGGGAYYGMLRDCRITNCHAYNYGGGAYYANLERCIIEGNSADNGYGGGTYYGTIDNCLIVNNYARNGGGGTYYGSLYNCTIVNNSTSGTGNNPGGSYYGSAYNTIIWGNTGGYGNYYGTSLYASNASVDPQFTSIDGNPWVLTMSSPCLDAGTNSYVRSETDLSGNVRIQNGTVDLGCYESTPLEGVPLTSVIVASGTYTYRGTEWCPTVTVRAGDGTLRESEHYTLEWLDNIDAGTARVVAHAIAPTFAGSVTNTFAIVPKTLTTSMFTLSAAYPFTGEEVRPDVTITESTLKSEDWDVSYVNNIAPGTATVTLTGKRNYTGAASRTFAISCPAIYVSTTGDDAEFGVSADAPKRSLQAAVTAAYDGAVIYVDDGVYQPITTSNKPIEIRSLNGWSKAIIDGGGTNRCATLGSSTSDATKTTLVGFTLRNGYADCGGGVKGGVLKDCVIEENRSTLNSDYSGGGAVFSVLHRCIVRNNVCNDDGGGASGCILYNCLVCGNHTANAGGSEGGGGLDDCTAYNCTIVGNTATSGGAGVCASTLVGCIVWGNSYTDGSADAPYSSSATYSCFATSVSGTGNIAANPRFVDEGAGDYRLLDHSPCIDTCSTHSNLGDVDLVGNARVAGAAPDMGCYEGGVELPDPDSVAGLVATDGRHIGYVRLSWNVATNAWYYRVERSSDESFADVASLGTTESLFFDDTNTVAETTYWYRVVGMNPAGEGEPSAADSGWCLGEMTFGENTLQTATAGLAYNVKLAISGGSGNYTWKTGADDYDVVYGESTYLVSDTVSTGVSGDDACLSYPLPFDFPFYGKSYNKVWVNSNGTLNFDGSYNGYAADEATLKTKAMIAVMWKDLRTGSGGVGVVTNGTESITFLWNGASYYSGGAAVNASVTLYADGTILCSYGSGNASGGFVGVSAGDGTHYRSVNLVGTSLDNYDDIRFVPQDVPGGMTLATDGTLSGVAAAPGTYTFTVFVTDSYGNGATQKVTLEVEENPNMRTVQFDLGEYGVRGGGGDLLQYVLLGGDATPPTVRAKTGWLFDGWTGTFTNIADSVVVTANYRSTFADLEVSSIEIPGDVMSGNNVEIRWTVANTGNPQFSGTMTEKVTLVSAADDSVTIDVASPSFNGTIARNGSVERSATVAVPLKGWVGTWKVRVETAIRPSVREFADNNVTVSTSTFEITAAPLPDLSVKSIVLDLDPAEYMPLDTVTVRYVVQNTGTGAATAPWRDRLYLCKDGAKVTLATVDISDDIAAGAEVERTIQCVIPELVALSGDVAFVVKADCDDSIVELADDDSNENATWEATPNATLGKRIYLAFNSASVYENSGSARFYAKRSGETDKALVLSLSAVGATSDVTFPAEITIGAGNSTASGYVYPIDNNVVEGVRNVVFTLTPPVGADFDAVTSTLTILDNEVPKLTMSFDKVSVKEGDAAIIVTVTRELVTDEPLTVYLNGVSTSHCSYPSSVVIPAGEASVTFELAAVDNDAAEIAAALTLRASANGYTAATQSFSVEDDDVPSVTLTIYPEELSEGAGPNAAYAILSRVNEDNIGSAITVNLTPSIPNQLILQSSVTIPAYTMAVRFQFGPVDNGDDEGDRDITITGSIYIPSCGCSSQPSSGDVIEATIRIIDNDTPALSLTADPSTMKEGLDHAGDLILSHNSVLTEDLVVTLSFDTEGEIEIPASVVIPAGETSVTIPVKTIDDGETDGGKLVSVYADDESGAFKSASTWIQVSDQNLPDLKVMAITRPSSVYAGKKFDIEFEAANVGFVAAPNEIEYAIHLVGGNRGSSATTSNKIYSGKITGGIVVNDSIVTSYTVTAPSDTGDYRIVVVLDPDGKISELDDANNSLTSDAIAVSAAYTATVTVAEKVYLPGDEIVFNGVATMPDGTTPAANLPVDLYVYVDGMRRTYHLTADSNGAFGMIFEPTDSEAGRYTIGACYPGLATSVVQDYFDILGMKLGSTSAVKCQISLDDIATRTVTIKNRSKTALTGLAATLSDVLEDVWDLSTSLPDTLPADGSITFRITAHAIGISPVTGAWDVVPVEITSNEGVSLSFNIYLYSQAQKAQLALSPATTTSKMTVGVQRLVELSVVNNGKGDSGKITVAIPPANWLRLVSQPTIDNLKNGETATITLEIYPKDEHNLVLNKPLSGVMGVSCANGTGANATLNFTPVSDSTGSIKVDVIDNAYANQADGTGPHLEGANIRLSNRYDNDRTVASGVTDANGIWTAAEIPVGEYQLTISAAMHDSFQTNVVINPGQMTSLVKFIRYNLVTQTWEVKRTEIEDQYEVTMMLDFDTSVPSSKVEMTLPDELPVLNEGESWTFVVHVVNSGLIQAENVTVTLPEIPGYTFSMSENDFTLPAKASRDISVVMKRPRRNGEISIMAADGSAVLNCNWEFESSVPDNGVYSVNFSYKNISGSDLDCPMFTIEDCNMTSYDNSAEISLDGDTYAKGFLQFIACSAEGDFSKMASNEERSFVLKVKLPDDREDINAITMRVNTSNDAKAALTTEVDKYITPEMLINAANSSDNALSEYVATLRELLGNNNGEMVSRLCAFASEQYEENGCAIQDVSSLIKSYSEKEITKKSSARATRQHLSLPTILTDSSITEGAYIYPDYKYIDSSVGSLAGEEVAIIAHGRADGLWKSNWMSQMASALIANTEITKVICIDWSVLADPPSGLSTYEVSDNIPHVVEVVSKQLTSLNLDANKCTFIGHSYGAHLTGRLAMSLFGNNKAKRHIGLDTARVSMSVHSNVAIGGSVAKQTEYYRSSTWYGRDDAYAKFNFIVCRDGDFIPYNLTRNPIDDYFSGAQTEMHGYSHSWFIGSISSPSAKDNEIGYWFTPSSLNKLPNPQSGYRYVINDDRYELVYPFTGICGGENVGIYDDWSEFKYPGGWGGWNSMRSHWEEAFDLRVTPLDITVKTEVENNKILTGLDAMVEVSMVDRAVQDIDTLQQAKFILGGPVLWKREMSLIDKVTGKAVVYSSSTGYSIDDKKTIQFVVPPEVMDGEDEKEMRLEVRVSHGVMSRIGQYCELPDIFSPDNTNSIDVVVKLQDGPLANINGHFEDGFVVTNVIRYASEEDYESAVRDNDMFTFTWDGGASYPGKNSKIRQYVWSIPENDQGIPVMDGKTCKLRYSATVDAIYPITLNVFNTQLERDAVSGSLMVMVVIGGEGVGSGDDLDNECWRKFTLGWIERCGEYFPVYGYSKYLKHGECPGNDGLIEKIRDDWHADSQPSGGYIGGPSTGGSGGGGASGGFSGGGGGFTITVDDCAKGGSNGNGSFSLTPCQKALVDCGISVAANFIPGAEYVMAFKDGWDCGSNIREAWGANGNGYDKFDAVLNCGFTVAGFIPGVEWFSTGASCLYNTVKECGFRYSEKKEAGTLPKQLLGALLRDGEEEEGETTVQTDFEKATVLYVTEINASCNWLIELFGSSDWCDLSSEQIKQFLTDARSTLDSNYLLSATTLRTYCPEAISDEVLARFVSRWNATVIAQASGTTLDDTDDDAGTTGYIRFEKLIEYSDIMKECREDAIAAGYETAYAYFKEKIDEEAAIIEANKQAVCASVTLKLSQTISMTREAFEGTLTMYNGHANVPITNLKMNLSIRDEEGNERKDWFVRNDLGNSGSMTGGFILDGGLSVAPNSSGSAVIQFIPERRTATDCPKPYSFGGTISYVDPFSGKEQTVKLIDVTLTVNPSPYLHLDYFIQRDIYGDDPFTDDTVEASLPAEMAVLVHNTELGEARNVTIASVQPSVFLNEKGLAAEFRMTDFSLGETALNGATAHLGLNTVSLGNIPGGESRVAQWWLTSSIDGHFKNMTATVTPVNSWNTPESSLVDLDHVGMHKLIRSLEVEGAELPWFLTSEIDDLYGAADSIYSPDGERHDVAANATVVSSGTLVGAAPTLTVTVNPRENGWNYIYVAKEGLARYTVESVTRDDGIAIPVRNVWITSKVFRDGVMPMFEERLHIADNYEIVGETVYTIVLSAKPTDVPEVVGFNVTDGAIEFVARNAVTVEFSKPIDPATFTADAITLRKQGVPLADLSSLTIAPADDSGTLFTISDLAALCGENARYELVVQCAGIYDLSGQLGTSGKSVSWTLAVPDSPFIIGVDGAPVKRIRRLDGLMMFMSTQVTAESAANLVVTLNGTDVSQFVTIRPADNDETGTRFAIEGLEELQLSDGDYELVIYGDNLVSLDDRTGVDSCTIHWTRDTIAPVVNTLRRDEGNMNGASFVLEMTEDADTSTISLDNLMLTRKPTKTLNLPKRGLLGVAPAGETEIALSADRVKLVSQGNGTYIVTGIDGLITEDGTYTLYFDASGVADEAGNEASGVKSVTWIVDTTPPGEVTDISVSSEYGSLDSCVYTTARELTISGTVPEEGLTVEILVRTVGGSEIPLAEPEVDVELRFTADVVLPSDGGMTIVIRLTDAAGYSTDTEFDVYVDEIALDADISGTPEPDETAGDFVVAFNATPDEATALAAGMNLTLDGVVVAIPNVTIAKTEDRVYTVSGLAEYTAAYGTYVFSYDVRDVKKVISGKTGEAVASVTWVNYPLDTTAPTITDIKFNGATPAAAYVTDQMFTEVAVRFSEAVNVPALVEQGVAGQAFSIQFLSDDNEIVGTLPAEDVAWNASTFTASWTIDGSAVPCGKVRLVVDASLVKDESGNGLATTEAYDIISGAKTYTPSVLKRDVAYSYACPELYDWNNDGLLDLIVGEKTENGKGKVRIYLNRGTASQPEFDDYTYLQKSGEDVEFTGAGCVGMQVSFGHLRKATMVLATSQGEIYGWRHRSRDPKTKDSVEWESWFDHSTDSRFAGLQRTQTFCCDIDGDGYDEVIVSGQNSPMFWLKRTLNNGEYETECTPLMDADGANLQFPAGQNHTAAIMTDVSGDAVLDLVTGDTAGNVWVYYGTGNARFSATPVMIYENTETSNKRSRLALGDINGDGVEDILVGRQDGSVLLFKGEAVLSPAVNFKCVEIKSVEEALNDYIYWVDGADGWTCEQFGEEAQATVTHTGDAQTTVLSAKFTGMGTVTFTWAVSGSNESSEFRCTGGDSEIVKSGPFNQLAQSVTISTLGEHVVNWVFTGRNTAIVRDVAFTPADESLQVTQTTVVPVAFSDINRLANEIWKANGGDYEAAAKATAANGKTVMDNCIAGVDSSDPNAAFKAKITYENNVPKISWEPALNGEVENEGVPTGIRTYKVYGADNLESPNWQLVTPENKPTMKFFRVTVEMP